MKKNSILDYEDFKELALNKELSRHEKIGGPNYVREGYNSIIIKDIINKMPIILDGEKKIVDIGCGCDNMEVDLVDEIVKNNNELWLFDSAEMLSLMPEHINVHKISGRFPDEYEVFIDTYKDKMDAILVYSVLQYVCAHGSVFNFIDSAMQLLKPGGILLLGDIPNRSKRRRFFASNEGIKMHKNFTGSNESPKINPWEIEYGQLDDSIVFAIMQRYRNGGHETYLLPQMQGLPFATRREDIFIVKKN